MKRIVITGALGHIGSRLIRALPEEFPGSCLVMVDNLSTQRYCSLFNLPTSASFEFHERDVADADIGDLIKEADVVIHLAATTDAERSLRNSEVAEKNLSGTIRVSADAARLKVPLIFASSTSVYGTQKEVTDENCSAEDLKPQSPYAAYKLKEEAHLLAQPGEFVICRFGTICGTSPGMRFHTAVNKFCFQAVMQLPITVWSTAYEQRRPYLELTDACRAVGHILRRRLYNREIYNVVTENATVKAIVETIKENIPDLAIKFVESELMNQLSYTIATEKFKSTGFNFSGRLSSAIKETIELLRQASSKCPTSR